MGSIEDAQNGLTALLAQTSEMLEPLMEASIGYAAVAKRRGFDDESACRMGADYHRLAMQLVLNTLGGTGRPSG